MTLQYYVPLEDNAEIQIYLFSRTEQFQKLVRSRQVFLMFFLLAFCALFSLLFKTIAAVLLSVVLFVLLMFLVTKRLKKTIFKSLRKISLKNLQEGLKGIEYDGDVIFVLGEDDFSVTGGENTITEQYYNLHHVAQEHGFVILYQLDEINGFPVPFSAFENEEDRNEFIALAQSRIDNAPPKPEEPEEPKESLEPEEPEEPKESVESETPDIS